MAGAAASKASGAARGPSSGGAAVVTPSRSSERLRSFNLPETTPSTPSRSTRRLSKPESVAPPPEPEMQMVPYVPVKRETWGTGLHVAPPEYWAELKPKRGSPAQALLDKAPVSLLLDLCDWDEAGLTIRLADLVNFYILKYLSHIDLLVLDWFEPGFVYVRHTPLPRVVLPGIYTSRRVPQQEFG